MKLAGLDGLNALLADADPCAQQDNADAMIAFANSGGVNNTDELIANAIVYRQHPRNAMNILGVIPSTVYCQKAPQSSELVGVVNAQLDGVDPGLFGSPNIPLMPFGARKYLSNNPCLQYLIRYFSAGTCPFGQDPDVTTCTCVNTTATEDPTSTDTSAANATATDSTAASATISGTSTESATDSVTATATNSQATGAASSAASDPPSSRSQDVATAQTSVATAAPNTSSAAAVSPAPSATAKSSGPSFQPADISGDVNDING